MADLNIPQTRKEVVEKLQTDIRTELPFSNPYLRNNFLFSIAAGMGGRFFDVYRQLERLLDIFFDDTTFGIYLEKKANPYGISRLAATKSTGFITVSGTLSSIIPSGTTYKTQSGIQYETLSEQIISSNVTSITSLTSSGGIATATTSSNHNLATGIEVTISGANESEYNITTDIQVTDTNKFTYPISGTPSSPATGTIIVTSSTASIEIESISFGNNTNQTTGTVLTLLSGISGIDSNAYVQYDGLSGGADIETDEELRDRYVFRKQNPVANFNIIAIENEARKLSFVDRVWVQAITPDIGQTTIYFSNKDGSTPTSTEIGLVKDQILTIKPVNTAEADVIVAAPSLLTVNFTFSTIIPSTSAIQQAVIDNLINYFAVQVELGNDIPESSYIAAIQNSRDITSGLKVSSFTLSSPTGDISVASDELPVLGTITF